MSKLEIKLSFDEEKLDALDYYLRKQNSTVQKQTDGLLQRLYEDTVPEAVREFVERKLPPPPRPKRPGKTNPPKPPLTAESTEDGLVNDNGAANG